MVQSLKIVASNAIGLANRKEELQAFLDVEKIYVCLISETYCTNQSYIKFRGYKVYYTVHPDNTARGGSAVIVRDNIEHSEEAEYKTPEIQVTAVRVKIRSYLCILAAIYSTPKHTICKSDYKNLFKQLGGKFIVRGDFNAKNTFWGLRLTNPKGKELLQAIKECKCEVLSTGKPTYWPTDTGKVPDLVDFFITKNFSLSYTRVEDCYDFSSDHSPIILFLNEKIVQAGVNPVLVNKSIDWDYFKLLLKEKI